MGEGSISSGKAASNWAWPVAFMVVILAVLGEGIYVFESLRRIPGEAAQTGRALLGEIRSLAEAFEQGSVETGFIAYATKTTGTSYFQFATLERQERVHRRDTSSLAWGRLPLPDVVVMASMPVTYTYFVDLSGQWSFQLTGRRLRVVAPAIRFNPPAIDPAQIELETITSSVFRDEEAALEELRAALSSMVEQRAERNIGRVRETGRLQIEEFVSTWLGAAFGDGGDYEIEVVFENELPRLDRRLD